MLYLKTDYQTNPFNLVSAKNNSIKLKLRL